MKLTNEEKHSALWQKLRAHIDTRLANLRQQNDNDKAPEETAKLRGRIAECKAFLGLETAQEQEADGE